MMNYLKIGLTTLAAALLFVACDKNDDPETPALPDNGNYTGTVSVAPDTDNAFTLENIEVKFTVKEDGKTADIEMLKVKFAAAMPLTIDMMIPTVELTKTNSGYSISGENIIPSYMNGTPFPERTITGLTGTVTEQNLSLSMTCGTYPMSFTGSRNKEQ